MLKTSELLPGHGSAASQWKRQHGARPLPNRVRDVQRDDKRVLLRGDRLRDRYTDTDTDTDTEADARHVIRSVAILIRKKKSDV